ncbi:MAG TPA: antibiotic biosynthesis monooxygenase [Kofleriaceae bacterium]|jgi:heme-degrading monooxygenase HmoA|nr:antibiotic biosynthesis monooxygenase [Kofleriaceae bacterium]
MVIVLIRTKLHSEADRSAYESLNGQMFELVQKIPGFLGASGYASGDGEDIGVIRFESLDALRVWREHPDHLQAQHRGRTEFYASYTIEVCEVVRAYDFAR